MLTSDRPRNTDKLSSETVLEISKNQKFEIWILLIYIITFRIEKGKEINISSSSSCVNAAVQ